MKWEKIKNWVTKLSTLSTLLLFLTGVGIYPLTRKVIEITQTIGFLIRDYPRLTEENSRNRIRMNVLMALIKANMPNVHSDSLNFEVLYDGKYIQVDIKQTLSGDQVVFLKDTANWLDVFWLWEQKDENKNVFLDNEFKWRWIERK